MRNAAHPPRLNFGFRISDLPPAHPRALKNPPTAENVSVPVPVSDPDEYFAKQRQPYVTA
jgi:hypothetical protein